MSVRPPSSRTDSPGLRNSMSHVYGCAIPTFLGKGLGGDPRGRRTGDTRDREARCVVLVCAARNRQARGVTLSSGQLGCVWAWGRRFHTGLRSPHNPTGWFTDREA